MAHGVQWLVLISVCRPKLCTIKTTYHICGYIITAVLWQMQKINKWHDAQLDIEIPVAANHTSLPDPGYKDSKPCNRAVSCDRDWVQNTCILVVNSYVYKMPQCC